MVLHKNGIHTGGIRSPYYFGDKTIDLAVGMHLLGYIHPGANWDPKTIEVLADGTVVDSNNSGAFIGGKNSISFNTVQVTVNTADYVAQTRVGHDPWNKSIATHILIQGTHYRLSLGWPATTGFTIDPTGASIAMDDPLAATVVGMVITLNTVPVTFNPVGYLGNYGIHYQKEWLGLTRGLRTLYLVPNQVYRMTIASWGPLYFNLDANGNVDLTNMSVGNTAYWSQRTAEQQLIVGSSVAGGAVDTITFKNIDVPIDAGNYLGSWGIEYGEAVGSSRYGKRVLTLVPSLAYRIFVGAWSNFIWRVAADGTVSVDNGISGTAQVGASGIMDTLVFNTVPVQIDSGTYTGRWDIWGMQIGWQTGVQVMDLVPGTVYDISAVDVLGTFYQKIGRFQLDYPCNITPPAVSIGAETFNVSCYIPVAVNNPPVADAGVGQNIYLGQMVYLDGAASSDPDGDVITSYTWTFDAVPIGSVFADPYVSLSGVAPTFTPDVAGDYQLSLVVNDGALNSAAATVMVTAAQNLAPIASVLADVSLGVAPLTVNFDASASYDPEGGAVTYSWNFADVASGANNIATGVYASHTFNTEGKYIVMLDVTDDFGNVTQASAVIDLGGVPNGASTGGDTGLNLTVHEAKVDYGKEGKVKGKVSLKAGVTYPPTIDPTDRIFISVDGVILVDTLFSEFKGDEPGEYEFESRQVIHP